MSTALGKKYFAKEFVVTGGTSSDYLMGDGTLSSGNAGNETIGTDTDLTTSGATVVDDINLTDGVVTAHSTRTLTLADLGYTGDADATNDNNYLSSVSFDNSNAEFTFNRSGLSALTSTVRSIEGGPVADINSISDTRGLMYYNSFSNDPTGDIPGSTNNANGVLTMVSHSGPYAKQIAFGDNDDLYIRKTSNNVNGTWREVYHDGNFTDNSSNWDTAFGWGDHSTEGYLTSSSTQSKYLRSDAADTATGLLTLNGGIDVLSGTGGGKLRVRRTSSSTDGDDIMDVHMDDGGTFFDIDNDSDGDLGNFNFRYKTGGTFTDLLSFSPTAINYKTHKIWHAGNDGAGSGQDADKLDAQEGTYYLDYNNFTNTPNLWDLTAKKTSINIDTEGDDNFWQYSHATQTTDGTHAGSYQYVVNFGDKSQGIQLSHTFGSSPNNLYFRSGSDNSSSENGANAYSDWRRILTTDDAYTHPTHPGDDISIDTTALTGAVVISDLDLNVTTDTLGHVTDANATVATRTLTLADLGFTGDTNANNSTPRTDEEIRDVAAAQWIDGTNTTVVVDDANNTIKINATGGASGIDGSGTVKMIPKFSDSDTLTDSNIFEANSGEVHINTTTEYIGMLNVYQDTTAPALMLIADDGGSSASPIMYMHRDSSSPADDDILGRTTYAGNDSSGSNVSYARIDGYIDTALTGSTNAGGVHLQSRLGATMYTNLRTGGNKSYADNTWYFDTEIQAEDGIKIYSGSTITLDSDSGTSGEVLVSKGASTPEWEHRVRSNTSEGGTGSVQVGNIVKITQSAYDSLGSKDADTIYFIVG